MTHTAFALAFARAGVVVPPPVKPPVLLNKTLAHRGLDGAIAELLTFPWHTFADDDLAAAAGMLTSDIDDIQADIAANPGPAEHRGEGWRRRAEDALRHKRRQLGAVLNVLNVRRKDEWRRLTAERAAAKAARKAEVVHGDKDRGKASSQSA